MTGHDILFLLANGILFSVILLSPLLTYSYPLFVQTDRAAMLDEIVDYVKFLRLQVKVKFLQILCVAIGDLRNYIIFNTDTFRS